MPTEFHNPSVYHREAPSKESGNTRRVVPARLGRIWPSSDRTGLTRRNELTSRLDLNTSACPTHTILESLTAAVGPTP